MSSPVENADAFFGAGNKYSADAFEGDSGLSQDSYSKSGFFDTPEGLPGYSLNTGIAGATVTPFDIPQAGSTGSDSDGFSSGLSTTSATGLTQANNALGPDLLSGISGAQAPAPSPPTEDQGIPSMESPAAMPGAMPGLPAFDPMTQTGLPAYGLNPPSSAYIPSSGAYFPTSGAYTPTSSAYTPTSSGRMNPSSAYTPTSSAYFPTSSGSLNPSSAYTPTSGAYTPTSTATTASTAYFPSSSAYAPSTSAYTPSSAGYGMNPSSAYTPTSSAYTPTSSGYDNNPSSAYVPTSSGSLNEGVPGATTGPSPGAMTGFDDFGGFGYSGGGSGGSGGAGGDLFDTPLQKEAEAGLLGATLDGAIDNALDKWGSSSPDPSEGMDPLHATFSNEQMTAMGLDNPNAGFEGLGHDPVDNTSGGPESNFEAPGSDPVSNTLDPGNAFY